jgi:DNA polymerase III delta' subunit
MIKETPPVDYVPKTILKQSVLKGRVAHAYLFYGPEISCLAEAAQWLAQALNCPNFSVSEEPCGDCTSCQKISKKIHPDVSICLPRGALRSIRIEQIRKIQQEASYKPFEGTAKVHIIQEADCLHPTSANALLKILEEPPRSTFFILLTVQPEALFLTIRSRCQEIQFKLYAQDFSFKQFPECENDLMMLEALKELSGGSQKKARHLIQEGIWDRRKLTLKFLEGAFNESWISMFGEVEKIVKVLEEDLENLESKIQDEEGEMQDSDLKKTYEEERKAFLSGERARMIEEILRLVLVWGRVRLETEQSFKALPLLIEAVEEARRYLERGANLKWVLEALMMKLKP